MPTSTTTANHELFNQAESFAKNYMMMVVDTRQKALQALAHVNLVAQENNPAAGLSTSVS